MAGNTESGGGGRRGRFWRIALWVIAALILLLPLVAMQFTDEVVWDETDFAVIGVMLFGACGAYELAARMTGSIAYRAAVGVALAAAFILVWMNLAVGIIGNEENPANLMYGGVLAVGIVGAIMGRLQPHGMARALAATALAQASVGVIALIAGLGSTGTNWPGAIVFLTGFFAALWLVSAWLFRKAAREQTSAGAAPQFDPQRPLSTQNRSQPTS
jgi:MFS family permease